MTVDYYATLQVALNADPEVIDAAFRRLARKYHPDVNASPDANERMRALNEAYEVLSEPSKRAAYDRLRAPLADLEGEQPQREEPPPRREGEEGAAAAPPRPPTGRSRTSRLNDRARKLARAVLTIGGVVVFSLVFLRPTSSSPSATPQPPASSQQRTTSTVPRLGAGSGLTATALEQSGRLTVDGVGDAEDPTATVTPTPSPTAFPSPTATATSTATGTVGPTPAAWPVVRTGDRGEAAKSVQYLLRHRGYAVAPDGDFGPQTEAAVRALQQARGKVVDGVVGSQTWEALVVTVQRGSYGEAIRAVQSQLSYRGYSVAVDADFGPQTEGGVRAFQQARGLTVDGVVGPQTWRALVVDAGL